MLVKGGPGRLLLVQLSRGVFHLFEPYQCLTINTCYYSADNTFHQVDLEYSCDSLRDVTRTHPGPIDNIALASAREPNQR